MTSTAEIEVDRVKPWRASTRRWEMPEESGDIRVLYVDDEPNLLEITREFLQLDGGMIVETSPDATDALGSLAKHRYDVIISDYQMPVMDGLSFLKAVRERGKDVPFILFTGKGREDVAIQALNNGADFYLQKGGDPIVQFGELRNVVMQLHKRFEAERVAMAREEQLEMLYRASQQLYASLELETIYQTMREFISTVMDCDGMAVSSYSDEDRTITCEYYWNGDREFDSSMFPVIPLEDEGRGIQSVAIRSGQPMIVTDYWERARTARTNYFITDEGEVQREEPGREEDPTRSALVVPIKHDGEVIGVVQVFSFKLAAFSEEHLRLLESLVSHASAAISIASYYDRMKFETAERSRVESLTNLYRNVVMSMRDGFILGRCHSSSEGMSIVVGVMNASAAEMIGVPTNSWVGLDVAQRFRQKYGIDLASHCETVMRTGEPATVPGDQERGVPAMKLFPLGDDRVGILLDKG